MQKLKTLTLILGLLATACSEKAPSTPSIAGRISPTYQGPKESDYCSTTSTYGDAVTITGTANYQPREIYGTTSVGGLGNPGTPQPIRRAEIRVIDSSGATIQCGETDNSGNFSLSLPRGGITYTISVNSRSQNSFLNASVLDAPEKNNLYSLTTTVVPDSSKSVGTFTALATGEVLSGAFNILDQMLKANDYLRTQVGTCGIAGCADFTVAPKVSAYWEKGFNPGDYYNSGPVSFYIPGYSRLFILGGRNGDVNSQDTDHFDNSVIIHEYAHFLEDAYTITNSPGGAHSGNKLIDPRLAFGEGWGNFFQAAVRNDPHYIDTIGNIDGSTDYIFYINLETPDAGCTTFTPGCDVPVFDGEGNFREFAITRMLWDVIDNPGGDDESVSGGFAQIWASLVKSDGLKNPNAAFRAIGLLHDVQQNKIAAPSDWSTARTLNKQQGDTSNYAKYVSATNGCGLLDSFELDPARISGFQNVSHFNSHLLKNNKFYHYKHPGGALTLNLNYQIDSETVVDATQSSTGNEIQADLDLYLYNKSAVLSSSSDILGSSLSEPVGTSGAIDSETISLSSLAAGDYLIRIYAYTGSPYTVDVGGPTNYELKANGVNLCPSLLP